MCPSGYRVSSPPGPGGGRAGIKPAPKPFLDRLGCVCKISSRSVQGFGFPLALHIPTDRQTNICMPIFIYIEIEDHTIENASFKKKRRSPFLTESN